MLAKANAASYAEMAKGTGLYQKFKNATGITNVDQQYQLRMNQLDLR